MRALSRLLFIASCVLATSLAVAASSTAVEYFHWGYGHYFVTASPLEITALDSGAFPGWTRTGLSFGVFDLDTAGATNVCRFWSGQTFAPKSSHFYTPYAAECAYLKQQGVWQYEGDVFALTLPDTAGSCPANTVPLYRLYNNGSGGAPNHRYTTNRAVFDQMRAMGWTPEGSGPQTTFACGPGGAATAGAAGLWEGTTSANEDLIAVVLSDGTFYFFYTASDGRSSMGLAQGTADFVNGSFASTDAHDYEFVPSGTGYPAALSGTYVSAASMAGTIATSRRTRIITAQPLAGMDPPMSLPTMTVTFTGAAVTLNGATFGNVALSPSGGLDGQLLGCTINGTVKPRSDVRVGDTSITISGSMCSLGSGTMAGVAIYEYEAGLGALIILARNAAGSDAIVFGGVAANGAN